MTYTPGPRLYLILTPTLTLTLSPYLKPHPKVNVNDLYTWSDKEKVAFLQNGGLIKVPVWRTLFDFFAIPHVKRANAIFFGFLYLLFQIMFFLRPLCLPVTMLDYVFALWAVAIVLEEVEQVLFDWRAYKQSLWNVLDCSRAVLGLLVVVIRFILASGQANGDGTLDAIEWWSQKTGGWAHQGSWMLYDDSRVTTLTPEHMCEWSWEMELVRTFASGLMLTSTIRLMEAMTLTLQTGVLLVCISRMCANLYNWAKLAMLLSSGFGFVMLLLAPEYRLDGSTGAWRPFHGFPNLDISSSGPFWMTYWGLLGFFEPGELSAASGSAFLAPLALWSYLLIALVLFVNLLIAMFSQSYAEVMRQADTVWKQQRLAAVLSYTRAQAMPPPFNLITLPLTLLYHRALPWCRHMILTPEPASTDGRGAARAARWGTNRKVKPAAGGCGGGGGGLGGGGGGPAAFKKSAPKVNVAAEMDLHRSQGRGRREMVHAAEMDRADDLFAAWTFTVAKAQAVEERARRAFVFS